MLATEPRTRSSVRWVLVIVALAIVAFVAAIAVQRNLFPFYSGDHDEPVYRFQAEMLRHGMISIPGSQNEFFRPWLSGPRDNHLVMAFTPPWPTVLMVSDVLTGSMLFALGASAALMVGAAFAFARELLGSTRRAVLATVILTLSPLMLLLSGTYLNYVIALALNVVFGALLLRGLRSDSRALLVASGVALGAAFFTRPYDGVLFALPFAVYVIATRRHDLPKVAAIAGWIALGALPVVAGALAYNVAVSGSPLEFPTTVQSEGFSQFGWGTRSVARDTPVIHFTVLEAFESLGSNLWAVPTWLFGTYLALGLAIFGAVRLWRTNRAICGLLIGLTFVFPIGYLAWWASSLTTNGALNGLGPHYYLPVLLPLAILAAHGAAEAARHRREFVVGGLAAAVVLTAIAIPPKISDKQDVTAKSRRYSDEVTDGLRRREGKPALVIQERRRSSYIMEPYPFLANPPDLDAPVLYARDRGARDINLLDQMPGRRAYRLVHQVEPGRSLDHVPVVVKPQSVVRGPTLELHTTIVNTSGDPTVTAYARFGKAAQRRVLDTDATKGERYEVTWSVGAHGLEYIGPPAPTIRAPSAHTKSRGLVIVGATFSKTARARDPIAVEHRYYARIKRASPQSVELLTAGEEWTRFGTPIHAWLPITTGTQLQVRISSGAPADR